MQEHKITFYHSAKRILQPIHDENSLSQSCRIFSWINTKVRTLETRIISNKKASEEADLINGADDRTLLELFNKTLQPILSSPQIIILYSEIENYINGVEK